MNRATPAGFHAGERAVQREAGVEQAAARLEEMLAPAELGAGVARFLGERTLLAITARDGDGRLWVSALSGRPGFAQVISPTTLTVAAYPRSDDPLRDLAAGEPVGLIAVDYARRRRFRLNGTLEVAGPDGLSIWVDEAYGNCPQFIPKRDLELAPDEDSASAGSTRAGLRTSNELSTEDRSLIAEADTFILGTSHPARGNDASHRGGPPGFVRVVDNALWWPDYVGNNMFNSLGNLRADPEAALLFSDFASGASLHLSGTAELRTTDIGAPGDDGRTGRRVVFTPTSIARSALPVHAEQVTPYALNPPLSDVSQPRTRR